MITPYSNIISVTTLEALLLDTYSGAAAAYSLRQLRAAYTGDAIRVRRASDNTEQDIGFVNNQLDTSALTTFCSGTNGFVKTWYDQSGNGYDATQTTAVNQPQIVSSGSVILTNGKPSIYFNNPTGSGTKWLDTFTQLSLFNVGSIYSVASFIDSANFRVIFANGFQTSAGIWIGSVQGATPKLQMWTANINTQGNINSFSFNTQILQSYFFESAVNNGHKIYVNNTLDTQATKIFSISTPITNGGIGRDMYNNDYPMYGYMNELVFYGEKTNVNNLGINTNINDFYSIY
jgi:hypothetical protein